MTPPPHAAQDFLFELGTEELPPLALRELEQALSEGIVSRLAEAGLAHGAVHAYATPRRLAVLVEALSAEQAPQQLRRRGPPVTAAFDAAGQPTRAAAAFAESCGTSVDQLTRAKEGKGEFLFYNGIKPGAMTVSLLPALVQGALDALPIPKRMRWGSSSAEFVRPVHWLVLLFGKDVVPALILDTQSGAITHGHRHLAPGPIALPQPARYAELLEKSGWVIADFAVRRDRIERDVIARAAELKGRAIITPKLLEEVTALVEWPVAIAGQFEARFLALPREVLLSTLQEHQRYFAVEDQQGSLLPWFITVSNIPSRDPAQVRAGNERVVRPRLSDAAFFWDQDRKRPLEAARPDLDKVTYQAKLGSIGEKARRVAALAAQVAAATGASAPLVARAAQLAKCDLVSSMVGEFPELQGIMGAYYAAADGEPAEVAAAIREHYLPRGAGDALPTTATGTTLALADKLDTLAGIFCIGQKPTGTRDPFGLRRAAIGVLRIAQAARLELDLPALVAQAVAAQPIVNAAANGEIVDYLMERLRAIYLERSAEGFTTEMFDAVLASQPRSPMDFDARILALRDFLRRPEAVALAAANKRSANILKKTPAEPAGKIDAQLFRADAERELAQALERLRPAVHAATVRRDYAAALETLATLRPLVDRFFDDVMVNDPDAALRRNRLSLLAELRALFTGIADLSCLPG